MVVRASEEIRKLNATAISVASVGTMSVSLGSIARPRIRKLDRLTGFCSADIMPKLEAKKEEL